MFSIFHHLFLIGFIGSLSYAASRPPTSPCDNVQGWREQLCSFAKKNLVHSAWGYEHGLRDYTLAMDLATTENISVDEEVVFAAALLHDMGGFPPYEKEGVDHALRSTQVVDPVLEAAGFPMSKSELVKKAILNHSYYDPTRPATTEGIVLHDADTLDFMGAMGIARLLSVVGREKGLKEMRTVVKVLGSFQNSLTTKLYGGAYTKKMGTERAEEMGVFLGQLKKQSYEFGLP